MQKGGQQREAARHGEAGEDELGEIRGHLWQALTVDAPRMHPRGAPRAGRTLEYLLAPDLGFPGWVSRHKEL